MHKLLALFGLAALVVVNTTPLQLRSKRVTLAFGVDSLPSPAAPGSAEPSLVTGADGRVYMSWLEPADSGHALRFAVLQGKTWSQPRTIRAGRDFFVNGSSNVQGETSRQRTPGLPLRKEFPFLTGQPEEVRAAYRRAMGLPEREEQPWPT